MKKAFTLSEALITLAIIGVLAAILIPVIDSARPDKDKITYKKAMYSMQGAVSNAMDSTVYSVAANSAAYWQDTMVDADDFCTAVADQLNTAGAVNCSSTSSYESPNFITTDGIRFWGLEGKNWDKECNSSGFCKEREIFVDRAIGTNELRAVENSRGRTGNDAYGMKIRVRYDGKISTPSDETYDYENDLIENSLQVTKNQ